jgi:hypothetical protein
MCKLIFIIQLIYPMRDTDELTELTELWAGLHREGRLARLQELLTDSRRCEALRNSPTGAALATEISTFLRSLGQAAVVHRGILSPFSELAQYSYAVSVHDIAGNFIWIGATCSQVFQASRDELLQGNLFRMMDDRSIAKIVSTHTSELFRARKAMSITYLTTSGLRLVSRVTEVMVSVSAYTRYGIMLKTRRSRGGLASKSISAHNRNTFRANGVSRRMISDLKAPRQSADIQPASRDEYDSHKALENGEISFSLAAHLARQLHQPDAKF